MVTSLLLLAACSAPFGLLQSNTQSIVIGQDKLAAQVTSLSGTPAVPAQQAVAIAKGYVTTWPQASAIRPRYVALTLRTSTGTVAWGIQNRPVWLVEFPGARYAPAAYPESACACDRTFQPPNTDVAIDAQTGTLVMDYGLADP
ncbi:MAG TPA: hypothetical protein VIU62_14405, partial [Chloroflexota bacterium]